MTATRTPTFNSELRRLNDIDPRAAQARLKQVQQHAEAHGPSVDEEATAAKAASKRTDVYDRARKADKKQVDKVLNHLLPLLQKHTVATALVADNLHKLLLIQKQSDLGSAERADALTALKHEVSGLEKQFARSHVAAGAVDPQVLESSIAEWSTNHNDVIGRAVTKFVQALANNPERVTQVDVGASAAIVGGYVNGGVTRSLWGRRHATLGVSVTGGLFAGVAFEITHLSGVVPNRKRALSSAIQRSSEQYQIIPGMMFWKKHAKPATSYEDARPSSARLSLGASIGHGELVRSGVNIPIFPLPSRYKDARQALGINYKESMLSDEALAWKLPAPKSDVPAWVNEMRESGTKAPMAGGSSNRAAAADVMSVASGRPWTTRSNSEVSVNSIQKVSAKANEAGSRRRMPSSFEHELFDSDFPEVPATLPEYEENAAAPVSMRGEKEKSQLLAAE